MSWKDKIPKTEEDLGVTYNEEGYSQLPNGDMFGHCTSVARYMQELLGVGEVMGFDIDDNPTVEAEPINSCGGHDFLVIDGRYIVDLWVSMFAGLTDQMIFDIEEDDITHFYGDPDTWEKL